jgi:tetratricopeptide (TPR) repeat protein
MPLALSGPVLGVGNSCLWGSRWPTRWRQDARRTRAIAWSDAYEHLRAADATSPLAPRDLELLAESARWSQHFPETLDTLERAQGSYEAGGERRDAARLALELAYMHWERADDAVAGGWMARATRLLEDIEECAEHGRLRLGAAHTLLRQGAVERSAEIASEVVEAGRRLGDRALEGLGLVNLAHAMIALEKVDEGLRLVDEASALAQTGSLDLDTTGSIFCSSIFACRNTGDWQRAGEWTEASMRWCDRNSVTGFPGLCRFHRAEVLRMRGALADAEREAREAIEELLSSAPRHAPFGFGELGEIQRRRGERDAAAASFRRCSELGGQPEPGLCLMRAAEGDAAGALRSLRETLNVGDALVREPGALLPACVAVALAAGDVDAARESVAQLEAHAAHAPNLAVLASVATAAGHVALEEGRVQLAIPALRRAIAGYFEMHAPYEAARSRLLLARALKADGDEAAAGLEREAAEATLERLGASIRLEPGISAAVAPSTEALMTSCLRTWSDRRACSTLSVTTAGTNCSVATTPSCESSSSPAAGVRSSTRATGSSWHSRMQLRLWRPAARSSGRSPITGPTAEPSRRSVSASTPLRPQAAAMTTSVVAYTRPPASPRRQVVTRSWSACRRSRRLAIGSGAPRSAS